MVMLTIYSMQQCFLHRFSVMISSNIVKEITFYLSYECELQCELNVVR